MIRLTRAQVREIDRRAIEEYHIPRIVLMENAARAVYDEVLEAAEFMRNHPVVIFCGPGNNGGDGLAIARHARNFGMQVSIILTTDPATFHGDARVNWEIIRRMDIPVVDEPPQSTEVPVFVDAIFGTGLSKPPAGQAAQLIELMNASGAYIVAVDLPSGLDCDSGNPLGPCVKATSTVTFVAEKAGFANPASREYTGEITVGDIGCPRELIEQIAKMPSP